MLLQYADHVTVRSTLGETEFADVSVEVIDAVLVVSRASRNFAWFAPGTWQVSFL